MEPATSIIAKLGGRTAVAEITGVHRTRPYAWERPTERKGTGGIIPHWHHDALLDAAKKKKVPLARADFLPTRQQDRAS